MESKRLIVVTALMVAFGNVGCIADLSGEEISLEKEGIGQSSHELTVPNWVLVEQSNDVCKITKTHFLLFVRYRLYVADRYTDINGCSQDGYAFRRVDTVTCSSNLSLEECLGVPHGSVSTGDYCPHPRTTDPAPSGNIMAIPSTVGVPSGQLGHTTIDWDVSHTNTSQVYVSRNGGPESLFAQSNYGPQDANWIQGGQSYVFRVYAGTNHQCLLDGVSVQGVSTSCGNSVCEVGEAGICIVDCGFDECEPFTPCD